MLTDVVLKNKYPNPAYDILFEGETAKRIEKGIYECSHFNFEFEFKNTQDFKMDYPNLGHEFSCYGVCDNVEQLKEQLPDVVTNSDRKFVIAVTPIRKSEQSSWGGWRWHKWGPYIGNQNPQHEYLYNEPHIDLVYTYHIYEIE